jgi:hypothetical protein
MGYIIFQMIALTIMGTSMPKKEDNKQYKTKMNHSKTYSNHVNPKTFTVFITIYSDKHEYEKNYADRDIEKQYKISGI